MRDLNELLECGCKWLNAYLIIHPRKLAKFKECQNESNRKQAVPFLLEEGNQLAKDGYLDEAIITFQQALKWNPELKFNPQAKAQELNNIEEDYKN